MKKNTLCALVTLLLTFVACSNSNNANQGRSKIKAPIKTTSLAEKQLALVNDRYLAYFHYGLNVHDTGTTPYADWGTGKAPASSWRPTGNDPRQWAKVVKAAGMKGGILTTKHIDGFALWDSKAKVTWPGIEGETLGAETHYDVGGYDHPELEYDTLDVVKAFVEAFRAEGLRVGLYFSITDFHHDIRSNTVTPEKIEFIKTQLTELLTHYGPLDYVNIDGYVETPPQTSPLEVPYSLIYQLVQKHQPGALIISHNYMGSYASTEAPFVDSVGQWSTKIFPNDHDAPKAASDSIANKWFHWPGIYEIKKDKAADFARKLNALNASNSSLVLNLSPNRAGRLDDEVAPFLAEIKALWNKPADRLAPDPSWGFSYDVSKNLAFQKPTRQSGSFPEINDPHKQGFPWQWPLALRGDIAVDGMTEGRLDWRTLSVTSVSVQSWWEVDLEKPYHIEAITLFNRSDCCIADLAPYKVEVRDANRDLVWSETYTEAPNHATKIKQIDSSGRYVRITLMREGQLQLAEVIVEGNEIAQGL